MTTCWNCNKLFDVDGAIYCPFCAAVLSSRVKGSEIIDFWQKGWPDGWYYDSQGGQEVESPDGDFLIDVDSRYDLRDFGEVCVEGKWWHCVDFIDVFYEWKEKQQ